MFTFGENETFQQVHLKKGNPFHTICQYLGLHLLLPNGEGIFRYQLPSATPITSVGNSVRLIHVRDATSGMSIITFGGDPVGAPLDVPRMSEPTEELIAEIHEKYMEALKKLYEDYNGKYGASNLELEIH